jgi:hypothetical protein
MAVSAYPLIFGSRQHTTGVVFKISGFWQQSIPVTRGYFFSPAIAGGSKDLHRFQRSVEGGSQFYRWP